MSSLSAKVPAAERRASARTDAGRDGCVSAAAALEAGAGVSDPSREAAAAGAAAGAALGTGGGLGVLSNLTKPPKSVYSKGRGRAGLVRPGSERHGEKTAGVGGVFFFLRGARSALCTRLLLHCAVPVILDGVVCPPREQLGNLGPAVAILRVCLRSKQ